MNVKKTTKMIVLFALASRFILSGESKFICTLTTISNDGVWSQVDFRKAERYASVIAHIEQNIAQQELNKTVPLDEQLPDVDFLKNLREIKAYYTDNSAVTIFIDAKKKQCKYVKRALF